MFGRYLALVPDRSQFLLVCKEKLMIYLGNILLESEQIEKAFQVLDFQGQVALTVLPPMKGFLNNKIYRHPQVL